MTKQDPKDWSNQATEVERRVTEPLAEGLREARASLTYRWLERIEDRVAVGEDEVFPTEDLLDHVPILIEAVCDFIEDPAEEGTAADEVIAKATELGEMRFRQGFPANQVLKEFEILGGVMLTFMRRRVTELGFRPDPADLVGVMHRVHGALSKILQATAARHAALMEEQRRDLDERLRLVHRALDGEIQPRLEELARAWEGASSNGSGGAGDGAGEDDPIARLEERVKDLTTLTTPATTARQRGVPLKGVINEAIRRVRPIARGRDLELRVAKSIPEVEVADAELEHCLVIYLTNALRHCTPSDAECWVSVDARLDDVGEELVVEVRNTGASVEVVEDITELARPDPWAEDPATSGPGVGLRFARETVGALGGRTWAAPAEDPRGAVFGLAVPARQGDEAP